MVEIDTVGRWLQNSLVVLATEHAEELESNRKITDEIGGLMTVSAQGRVAKGPLTGRLIRVSISIDPETD